MTKIPCTEKTDDFIYRLEVKKGSPPQFSNDPHLLEFDHFIESLGTFHSIDVSVLRDGRSVTNVDFLSFEHSRQDNVTYIRFKFRDNENYVVQHDYLLTVILRYLI